MDVVEFLTARLDAEEAVAQDLLSQEYPLEYRHQGMHANIWSNSDYSEEGISFSPERVLADVAVKRRIIELMVYLRDKSDWFPVAYEALALLTQPYKAHPDFDPSWGQQ